MILTGRSVFFFAILVLTLWSARKGRDLFSPIRLYLLVHCFGLFISCLDLSPYSKGWNNITWYILFLSAVAYVLGALSFYFFAMSRGVRLTEMDKIRDVFRGGGLTPNIHRFRYGVLLCFVAYVSVYIWGISATGSVPLFADEPNQARIDFVSVGSAMNFLALYSVPFLLSLTLLLSERRRRLGLMLMMTAIFIMELLLLTKFDLIKLLFMSALIVNYLWTRFSLKPMLIFATLFLALFLSILVIRDNGDFTDPAFLDGFSKLRLRKGYEALGYPMMYIITNYWNLNYGMELAEEARLPKTYGYRTFHAVFQSLQQGKRMDEVLGIGNIFKLEIQKVKPYNTVSYHWYLFQDFGYAGVVLANFIFGLIIAYSYVRLRTRPGWWSLHFHVTLAWFVAFSFFHSVWYFLGTWIALFTTYGIISWSKEKGCRRTTNLSGAFAKSSIIGAAVETRDKQ